MGENRLTTNRDDELKISYKADLLPKEIMLNMVDIKLQDNMICTASVHYEWLNYCKDTTLHCSIQRLVSLKSETPTCGHHVNIRPFFWPICDCIKGVPLYLCDCYRHQLITIRFEFACMREIRWKLNS